MKIFIKYILKSMIEKKARFLLLVFAIAMSTGLFIGSMGAVNVALGSFTKPILQGFEGKEIVITPEKTQPFFSIESIKLEGVKDLLPALMGNGVLDTDTLESLTFYGREIEYINIANILEGNYQNFEGKKAIISKRISDDYNLQTGENIKVILNGERVELEVVAINANQDIFYADTKNNFSIIVPYDFLEEQYSIEGQYNFVLANKAESTVKDSIDTFNDTNSNFKATELFDEEAVLQQLGMITSIFYVMLIIVVLMSSVIIYGSFKLTITERLPVIGTFFSQGATRGNIKRILYLESVLYGLIGGGTGGLFGVGLLYLINYAVSPLKEYGIIEPFNFNSTYLGYGLVFALVLSVFSATVPVLRTDKLQVKEIILNNINKSPKKGFIRFGMGSIMLLTAVGLNLANKPWVEETSGLLLVISFIGLIMVYPQIMKGMTNVIFKKSKEVFGVTSIALNNVRTSKALRGNITLMIISIMAIVLINSVGVSLKAAVVDAYTSLDFDIEIGSFRVMEFSNQEKLMKILEDHDGINQNSIQEVYYIPGEINETNILFMGVEATKFKNYNKYLALDSEENYGGYKTFEDGKANIVLTKAVANRLNINQGDSTEIKINGITKKYKVAGIVDGKLFNNGQFILIKSKELKEDFSFLTPSNFIVLSTTKEADVVKNDIEKLAKELGSSVSTFDERVEMNLQQNQMLISILGIFSLMAVVIGALGAINNMLISFIQRKKELAMLSAVGMTKGQRGLMLMMESVMCVVWSMVIVVPYCYLALSLISKTTRKLGLPLDIRFNVAAMPMFFMTALIIYLLATLPVLFNNKKLSIIHEIKYE